MKKKGTKREQHEIDASGLVQLLHTELIKLCQICSKSSRIYQLIQCDFCPLLYHQGQAQYNCFENWLKFFTEQTYSLLKDCLNPPLTNIPRSKWMCPAHPEKFFNDTQELFNSQKVQIHDIFTNKGTFQAFFSSQALL